MTKTVFLQILNFQDDFVYNFGNENFFSKENLETKSFVCYLYENHINNFFGVSISTFYIDHFLMGFDIDFIRTEESTRESIFILNFTNTFMLAFI